MTGGHAFSCKAVAFQASASPNWADIGGLVVAAIALLVSATVAIIVAVVAARSAESTAQLTTALQQQIEYATGLHERRLESYQQLYAILEPLGLTVDPPTEDRCREIAEELSHWYYQVGGVYASEELRNHIFRLRYRLLAAERYDADNAEIQAAMTSEQDLAKCEFPLRRYASELRTDVVTEVFSRRSAAGTSALDEASDDNAPG